MKTHLTYFTFISYSHKDECFAKKLQRYLTSYKLPKPIQRKFPNKAQKCGRIFRDATDLTQGKLNDEISKALASSSYLVVICSDNTLKPNNEGKNWIEKEVNEFLRHHEPEYVIPIILRRKGNPTPKTYLPEKLKELDIRALDVVELGKRQVFSKTVAALLDIPPDTIWNWYQRDRRMHIAQISFAASCIISALAWWCWYYYAPHVSYYTDYVEHNFIPSGIYQLSKEQVRAKYRHYRFTTQKLQLRKVEYCNSLGGISIHEDPWNQERPSSMELHYDESGALKSRIHRDDEGKLYVQLNVYDNNIEFIRNTQSDSLLQSVSMITSLTEDPREIRTEKNPSSGRRSIRKGNIGNHLGVIYQEQYIGDFSTNQVDAQGLAGRRYELDSMGRTIAVHYLASHDFEDRLSAATQKGIGSYTLTYDEKGMVTSITYRDIKGNRIFNELGWSKECTCYDQHGNPVERLYYDTSGKRCLNANGYSRAVITYDEQGNPVSVSFYDTENEACLHAMGYSSLKMKYNKHGQLLEVRSYGLDGQPCTNLQGYSCRTIQRDSEGRVNSIAFLGTNDTLCIGPNDCALLQVQRNQQGNVCAFQFLGTDGTPCTNRVGFSRITTKIDQQGNQIYEAIYDKYGKRTYSLMGHSAWQAQHDSRGNETRKEFYDVKDKRCIIQLGYSRIDKTYDNQGNITTIKFYDSDDKPCLHKNGYAQEERKYNERGLCTERIFYGLNGQRCMTRNGESRIKIQYDDYGNTTQLLCFNTHDKPTIFKDEACAQITRKYDMYGNLIEQCHFDVCGNPCTNRKGVFCFNWTYDNSGNRLDQTYRNTNGVPCRAKRNEARITWKYDAKGNKVEEKYFSLDDSPWSQKDGVSKVLWAYDIYGNIIEETVLDENNTLLAGWSRTTKEYDAQGNCISQSYFDATAAPWENRLGFARIKYRYDQHQNMVEESYWGKDGNPTLNCENGAAIKKMKYDARNRCIEERFYGTNGQPVSNPKTIFRIVKQYDEYDNLKEEKYYDVHGSACLNYDGYASIVHQYNKSGELIESTSYSINGIPCHRKIISYDKFGTETVTYHDINE